MKHSLILSIRFVLLIVVQIITTNAIWGATVNQDGINYEVYISGTGNNAVADSAYVGNNQNYRGSIANIASSVSYEYSWSEFVGYDQYGNPKYETRTRYLTAPVKGIIDGHYNTGGSIYGAFAHCKSLSSVIIPNTVEYLGILAFAECTGITNVELGNSVTTIGMKAFLSCSNMTVINIPNSVKTIGREAFSGCTALEGTLTIPNSVTEIEHEAFYHCSNLSSVVLGNSVRTIGNFAFCGCTRLAGALTVPNSVISIGSSAFSYCSNLTSLYIPNSVDSIGLAAFEECSGLISAILPNTISIIEALTFHGCSSLNEISIPNSVKSIGYRAFEGCVGLTSIDIPNSVISIAQRAFYDCMGISKIHIGKKVSSIGQSAFYNCTPTELIWDAIYYPSGIDIDVTHIESATIGTEVQILPMYFMRSAKITEIIIPNSVSSIGREAFYNCSLIQGELVIPNSVTSIGMAAFGLCSGLTSVSMSNSIDSIGPKAFHYCSGLTRVEIDNLASWCKIKFGDYYSNPLYYARKLYLSGTEVTNLVIPSTISLINKYAFYRCSSLTDIIIPNSVTSIGDYAFYNCSNVANITCLATTPPLAQSNSFSNYSATLHVPVGSIEAYQTTSPWSNFTNIVGINEPGDVNGDGGINISDVTALIDLLLSGGEISAGADVNGDGQVNISDVTALIDRLLSGN